MLLLHPDQGLLEKRSISWGLGGGLPACKHALLSVVSLLRPEALSGCGDDQDSPALHEHSLMLLE